MIDITESKKSEEALKESEEKYRTLVENTTDLIFMIDKSSKVLSVNKSAAVIFEKKPEDLVGKSIYNLFLKDVVKQYSNSLKEVFNIGKSISKESKIIVKGVKLWLNTALSPLKDQDNKTVAVIGISHDITERKKSDQALKKRTKELEKFHKVAVGRELKMIELKEKIKNMEKNFKK